MVPAWPLRPGLGLGTFTIGASITAVITAIKEDTALSECPFYVSYNESAPTCDDVELILPSLSLRLAFDSRSQRLGTVTVTDPTALTITYEHALLSTSARRPTFLEVYELFGPTFPGKLDEASGLYLLQYRGVTLTFPIPAAYHSTYGPDTNALPMRLPDGTEPALHSIAVYGPSGDPFADPYPPSRTDPADVTVDLRPKPCPLCASSSGCITGFALSLCLRGGSRSLSFGASTQECVSVLGPPTSVFARPHGKLAIHGASLSEEEVARGLCARAARGATPLAETAEGESADGDYFWNYSKDGIDLLFDRHTHTLKKILLHTNFPGHVRFNEYSKCRFEVRVHGEGGATSTFNADTPWEEVERIIGPTGRPMVRAAGAVAPDGQPTSTYMYARCGVVVEVVKEGVMACLTLFDTL